MSVQGVQYVCGIMQNGSCPFKIDSGVSHEEYVLRDFPSILQRIEELEAADCPSPA